MPIKTGTIEGATKGNPLLRELLREIAQWQASLADKLGFDPLPSPHGNISSSPPPQIKALDVQGVDGRFLIKITPAANVQGQVLYLIESSQTTPFESSTTLVSYGPTPGTTLDVTQPNETRFWRVKSKFPGSSFGSQFIVGPVESGLLKPSSAAPGLTTFQVINFAPLLIQDDTNARIIVNSVSFAAGTDQVITYDGGLITNDDEGNPLVFSDYYVYADDPTKSGGAVTFIATQDASAIEANDNRVFFGFIELRESGGAVAFPDGVSGGPAKDTLVTLIDGTTKLVQNLIKGDAIFAIDRSGRERVSDDVIAIDNVPCFTLTTQTGKVITVSSDHTLQFGAGGRAPIIDIVPGDIIDTALGQEEVTSNVYAGRLTVYHIPLSKNRYHLGNGVWCG